MGQKFPSMKASQLEAIVALHCTFIRQRQGSHRIYQNREGKRFPFAFHKGDEVIPRLVRKVLLQDVALTMEEAQQAVGM